MTCFSDCTQKKCKNSPVGKSWIKVTELFQPDTVEPVSFYKDRRRARGEEKRRRGEERRWGFTHLPLENFPQATLKTSALSPTHTYTRTLPQTHTHTGTQRSFKGRHPFHYSPLSMWSPAPRPMEDCASQCRNSILALQLPWEWMRTHHD